MSDVPDRVTQAAQAAPHLPLWVTVVVGLASTVLAAFVAWVTVAFRHGRMVEKMEAHTRAMEDMVKKFEAFQASSSAAAISDAGVAARLAQVEENSSLIRRINETQIEMRVTMELQHKQLQLDVEGMARKQALTDAKVERVLVNQQNRLASYADVGLSPDGVHGLSKRG